MMLDIFTRYKTTTLIAILEDTTIAEDALVYTRIMDELKTRAYNRDLTAFQFLVGYNQDVDMEDYFDDQKYLDDMLYDNSDI